ncbi:MAG: HlyD family secretion protein [Gemmatimonadales bacterium]
MRVRISASGVLAVALIGACGGETGDYLARGTVEVHEVDLAAPSAARVTRLAVDEGSRVRAGDTIAVLAQADLPATVAGHEARLATALANLRDLEAGSRREEIRQGEAELAAASAEVDRTTRDLERARALAADKAIARQDLDHAEAAHRVAVERRRAAEESVRLLRAGTRPQQIAMARAEVSNARAALEQVRARAGDLVLTAPVAGVILGRHAEPGEMLAPNVPVVTLGETERPYVRVYLPQRVIRWLAPGQKVTIESGPDTLTGTVSAINPRAEFTPRVALTEDEREDLMFGVKIEPDAGRTLLPGLWVVVRVREPGSQGVREPGE